MDDFSFDWRYLISGDYQSGDGAAAYLVARHRGQSGAQG
jgi:hypothetical protein